MTKLPEHFDWVGARDRCSIEAALTALRCDVRRVTASRNRLSGSEPFVFAENGTSFSVTRKADAAAVEFGLDGRYIRVSGYGTDPGRGTIETRLDDDGQCVLFLDGARARYWRITNDALDAAVLRRGDGSASLTIDVASLPVSGLQCRLSGFLALERTLPESNRNHGVASAAP